MARKSRYAETAVDSTAFAIWNTAGYIRLSGDLKDESDTLANQELLLRKYVYDKADMKMVRVFSDEGFTGTNFDRPGFEALLEAIRRGEINCIIVKDLSRFGRDYIDAGDYIETVFPNLGVRFIAVNDSFDSDDPRCWEDGVSIALKNIINAAYAKDISVKMRTAFDAKRRKGDYTGSLPPFGYRRSPDNSQQLIIDEYAADAVRNIFKWRIEGATYKEIAKRLDNEGVPSPYHYAYLNGTRNDERYAQPRPWEGDTTKMILKNVVYIGHLFSGKNMTTVMRKWVKPSEDKWVTSYNTHEPIVSQADFDAVSELTRLLLERRCDKKEKIKHPPLPVNILKGFIYCSVCGYTFNRIATTNKSNQRVIHYTCTQCRKNGTVEKIKSISLDQLITVIREVLLAHIKLFTDTKTIAERLRLSNPVLRRMADMQSEIDKAQKRIAYLQNQEERLLSDYYDGILSKDDYNLVSRKREDEKNSLTLDVEILLTELGKYKTESWDAHNHTDVIEALQNQPKLTKEMLETFVERIEVDRNMNVTIMPRYKDEFEATVQFINENGGDIKCMTAA
jgi:DNA invertase Pin-like site-specific DNA recombinase/transposase-like protein